MTEHRPSTLSNATATISSTRKGGRDRGTRLLTKVHAIRPVLSGRDCTCGHAHQIHSAKGAEPRLTPVLAP